MMRDKRKLQFVAKSPMPEMGRGGGGGGLPNCLVNIYQAHHTRGWSNPCPHPFPRPFPFPFTHLLAKSYRNCICGCNLNCNCRTRPASTHPTLGNPLPLPSPRQLSSFSPLPSRPAAICHLLCLRKSFSNSTCFFHWPGISIYTQSRSENQTQPNWTELN